MDHLNQALFLWLNAPGQPPAIACLSAIFLAKWLIWAVPLYLGASWLLGGQRLRTAVLTACAAAALGLSLSMAIGLAWPHPRPFMLGLGHQLLAHAPDASFPSDHLTLWWSVALSTWLHRDTRSAGAAMALTGLGMAWARIYVGVHFPLDMVGALGVAAFSAWLSHRAAPLYLPLTWPRLWLR